MPLPIDLLDIDGSMDFVSGECVRLALTYRLSL